MTNSRFKKALCSYVNIPVFQNKVYKSPEEAKNCVTGDVTLIEDLTTGLVYNESFLPELMNYDSDYNNEQSISVEFKKHLENVLKIVGEKLGKTNLVEVGCGKGYFLEMLLAQDFDVTGFDAAYEGDNPRIEKRFFNASNKTNANGLVLRHVLEHVQNPFEFLVQLKEANQGGGLIYIEVPCFDWICKHDAWFDILYEHVNYFRINDFYRMFGRVIECGRLFGDQYVYVIADLSSLRKPIFDKTDAVNFPKRFMQSIQNYKDIGKSKGMNVIWGGASKGVLFSLLLSRIGQQFDMVIDINPAKQGGYLPITALRVYSPEDSFEKLAPNSSIFVMNSNYLNEIKRMSNNKFNYVSIDE